MAAMENNSERRVVAVFGQNPEVREFDDPDKQHPIPSRQKSSQRGKCYGQRLKSSFF
jgi:hypothetical protein